MRLSSWFVLSAFCFVSACGSSSSSTGAGSSNGGVGTGTSSSSSGGAGSGSADGGDGGGSSGSASGCSCDSATQYCLHGDTTTSGQHDVYECQMRLADCADCSCYSQRGVCLEEGTPKACSVSGGLVTVECAEIP